MLDSTNPSFPQPVPELDEFVSELMQATGALTLIVNQMMRFELSGRASPSAEPVPETLRRLLASVLPPIVQRYGPAAVAQAAAIVAEARDLACDGIFALDGRLLEDRPGAGAVVRRRPRARGQ